MQKLIALLLCISLALPLSASGELAEVFYACDMEDKRIALTFDDGPHFRYTAQILDILKEYKIPATFFVVGQLASEYPELVVRELAEGHEIASHTWSHPHIQTVSKESLDDELRLTEQLLTEICGVKPRLFRPPEGKCGSLVLGAAKKRDYKVILWSIDTRDWARTPPDLIVEGVLKNARPGAIILCHDFVGGESPTPEALRRFIPKLIENGYEFVTVSELINYANAD